MKFIDRTGEVKYNKFGSKMEIITYRCNNDIDVYFEEYDWIYYNAEYKRFKNGQLKCPYEKTICNKGYIGEGEYRVSENKRHTNCYLLWKGMLHRCYDKKYHKKHLTYKDCEVCEEWLNFQNYAKWKQENYYQVNDEKMHLDKDILIKGNKIYSPKTCVFVPHTINELFTKSDKTRGNLPIGVSYDKESKKYKAYCKINGKQKTLGRFDTPQEAFQVYKIAKEKEIKRVADEYKPYIPQKLYEAMYNYKVEITD